jgi:hypothetical protein
MCLLRISQEMKGMNFLITTITIDNWNSFSQADMVVSPQEKGAGRETMGKVSADGERS